MRHISQRVDRIDRLDLIRRSGGWFGGLVSLLLLCGCGTSSEVTTSRVLRGVAVTGAGAVGAAGGAAAGTLISPGNPAATIGGAAIGGAGAAGLASLLLGPDRVAEDAAFDDGYRQGESDELKRLYWARQNLQREGDAEFGRQAYYSFAGPSELADGTQLVPHEITISIIE